MAPSPIPAPLPPWAKALLQLAPLISIYLQDLLDHIGEMKDVSATTPDEWRHVQAIWNRAGSTEIADRFVTTFDIVNITGGAIDSSWTDADYTTVDNLLAGICSTWTTQFGQNGLTLDELRYYKRAFNPYSNPKPFEIGGPPEKVFAHAAVGTEVTLQPNQVAFTSTDITAYPRHWGRNYWPCPSSRFIEGTGHITNAAVDSLATMLEDNYNLLSQAEFFPVVPVTQVLKQPTRGLLTLAAVQVDNNPDVVRRRRLRGTTYRKVLPVGP